MSGDTNTFDRVPEPELLTLPPKPRRRLMASRRGKFAVVGGAFALIVLAASALFFLFGQVSSSPSGKGIDGPSSAAAQTVQAAAAAPTPAATLIAEEPADVPLTEVFTFRDIFEPLVKPKTANETSSESSPTTPGSDNNDNGSGASANSILLQDITVSNGEPTAVVVWEGDTYNVQEGDQVDNSPWKVLDIQSSSVVMLFGDTQVVLSVGQQVSK